MSDSTVRVETKNAVTTITLNRPDNGNALDMRMGRELLAAAIACRHDPNTRAVVLTGAGKAFCFGGDLQAMKADMDRVDAYLEELTTLMHAAVTHFVRMDAPVIAAVNGAAAGAGLGLVAMADLAIASDKARFSSAYTAVGLVPDGGTSFFLPRAVGTKRAMELLLLNRSLTAEEACDWGLVNQVVPAEQLMETATALAERLANGATRAFGRTKRLVASSIGALEAQMAREGEAIAAQAATPEGREGIEAFLAKRTPRFAG